MEKALKFLKRMKQTDTPYNFRECGLDEAIAELEEAMKPKTCEGCKSLYTNQYDEWSNYCKELNIEISNSTTSTFYCYRYEPKDNA